VIDEESLAIHHIVYRYKRETQAVRFSRDSIDARRTRRTLTAPQNVGAYNEIFIGIEAFCRTNHTVPPSRLPGPPVKACSIGISRKSVDDQDRIGAVTVEFAVSFVGDRDRFEFLAALQQKPTLRRKRYGFGFNDPYAISLTHFIFSKNRYSLNSQVVRYLSSISLNIPAILFALACLLKRLANV